MSQSNTPPVCTAFEVAYAKIFGGSPRDAQHRQACMALWQAAQPAAANPAFLVIVEGSEQEQICLHVHESLEAAEAEVERVRIDGADLAAPVVEIPPALAAHGEPLYDLIENVLGAHSEMILSAIAHA